VVCASTTESGWSFFDTRNVSHEMESQIDFLLFCSLAFHARHGGENVRLFEISLKVGRMIYVASLGGMNAEIRERIDRASGGVGGKNQVLLNSIIEQQMVRTCEDPPL
jgi:hypothetical protein